MKKLLIASLLAGGLPIHANAEVNLSGFASIVGGTSTDSDAIVRGYEDSIDFKEHSFFALQAYSDLGDGLSATAQIRSRGRDDWEPEFTWAFLSYEVSPSWRIQAGRQRIPMYLYSDYLDVSYAYHWIAPPSEVYKAPFDSIDGISTIHDFTVGDAMVNFRLYYGKEDFSTDTGSFEIEDIFSAVASVNYGWWTFRTSYLQFDLSGDIGLGELVAAWQATPFAAVGNELDINNDSSTAFEIGVIYDNQDWLFLAEYIPSTVDETIVGDYKPWMVSVGKRFGSYMVHATVGEDVNEPYRKAINSVPLGVDPGLDFLYQTTTAVLDERDFELPFYSVGLRWDFHDSAAFKFEYTVSEQLDGSNAGAAEMALVTVF